MIIIFKNKNEKESFTKIVDIDTMVKHGADLIAISNNRNFDYVACSPAGHTSPRKVDLESFKDLIINLICRYTNTIQHKMNNKKFRVWNNIQKKFEYFELGNITVLNRLLSQHSYPVQQFLGILDKNMKEVYEGDVVKGTYGLEGIDIVGEVIYSYDLCCYVVDWHYEISNIAFDSLEIVGNMIEDYMYDESGKLIKNENE